MSHYSTTERKLKRDGSEAANSLSVSGFEGFTLLELLCVIGIIAILASLLLPALEQVQARAKRIQCVNQLHEAGLAFHAFAHDHGGKLPMQIPASEGGSLEFVQRAYQLNTEFYFSFRLFQPLSNELVSSRILVCPADTRSPAGNFSELKNENLSYFVGVGASLAQPTSILAGDRNITNEWSGRSSLLQLGPNQALHWTSELHKFKGNLLFADSHVEESGSEKLKAASRLAPATTSLFLPSVPIAMPATVSSTHYLPMSNAAQPSASGWKRSGDVAASSRLGAQRPGPSEPGPVGAMAIPKRANPQLGPTNAPRESSGGRAQAKDTNVLTWNAWLASALGDSVHSLLWLLYLILVLLAIAALELRRRLRARKRVLRVDRRS